MSDPDNAVNVGEPAKSVDVLLERARMFDRVFAGTTEGQAVLDVLDAKFRAQRIYQAGGLDGQRETDRRAAQKEVIDFIYDLLRRAQQGDRNE